MDPGMLPQVQGIGSVYDGPRDVATSTRGHRDPGIHKYKYIYDGPRDVATSTRHRVSI